MTETVNKFVHLIPVARVIVVNPRIRSKKSFKELVENIAALGLKKPITVTLREESDGPAYDLVCGQGRLNAQPDRSVVIGAPPVGYNDHFCQLNEAHMRLEASMAYMCRWTYGRMIRT